MKNSVNPGADRSADPGLEERSAPRAARLPGANKVPKPYLILVTIVCLAGLAFGSAYAAHQHIPPGVAAALCAAGLLQLCAYSSLAFPALRRSWTPARLLLFAPWPWLIYSLPCGLFRPSALVALLALAAVAVFWFHLLPRGRLADLGFVALLAAPVLFNWFAALYPSPAPKLPAALLGHLFWIQAGLATILNVRGIDPDFGFWPAPRHWRAGLLWYLAALPPLTLAVAWTGFAHFVWPATWLQCLTAGATFFGILWVVALSEEFFFRALLQQWFEDWSRSAPLALLCASLLFGAAHLGYHHFPNWRFALLAALSGVAYGMAYRKGGLRAAMVAHALLVTTWRTFLR